MYSLHNLHSFSFFVIEVKMALLTRPKILHQLASTGPWIPALGFSSLLLSELEYQWDFFQCDGPNFAHTCGKLWYNCKDLVMDIYCQSSCSIHWSRHSHKNLQDSQSVDCCDNICFWNWIMFDIYSSRCWFLASLYIGKIFDNQGLPNCHRSWTQSQDGDPIRYLTSGVFRFWYQEYLAV